MNTNSISENQLRIKEWVNTYSNDLYSWAIHKVSDSFTAEDLVQDTFVSAFQNIHAYEGKSNPKTWLFAILNRKIIDYYRKCARSVVDRKNPIDNQIYKQSDALFDGDDGWKVHQREDIWGDDKELLDNIQFRSTLESCFQKLPPNWSKSIEAKYLLEKDSKTICQELDITPTNYWQILHRAKLLLKECLEQNWFKI